MSTRLPHLFPFYFYFAMMTLDKLLIFFNISKIFNRTIGKQRKRGKEV